MRAAENPLVLIRGRNGRRLYTILIGITSGLVLAADVPDYYDIPDEVRHDIDDPAFRQSYTLIADLNPFYLRGDFDGDGLVDYAFLVTMTNTGKRGIAIWMSRRPKFRWEILGAGHAFQYGAGKSDNLDFDAWQVYGRRRVGHGAGKGKPPRLVAEAIFVEIKDSASGLIYWTGRSFSWYQQGD